MFCNGQTALVCERGYCPNRKEINLLSEKPIPRVVVATIHLAEITKYYLLLEYARKNYNYLRSVTDARRVSHVDQLTAKIRFNSDLVISIRSDILQKCTKLVKSVATERQNRRSRTFRRRELHTGVRHYDSDKTKTQKQQWVL